MTRGEQFVYTHTHFPQEPPNEGEMLTHTCTYTHTHFPQEPPNEGEIFFFKLF